MQPYGIRLTSFFNKELKQRFLDATSLALPDMLTRRECRIGLPKEGKFFSHQVFFQMYSRSLSIYMTAATRVAKRWKTSSKFRKYSRNFGKVPGFFGILQGFLESFRKFFKPHLYWTWTRENKMQMTKIHLILKYFLHWPDVARQQTKYSTFFVCV